MASQRVVESRRRAGLEGAAGASANWGLAGLCLSMLLPSLATSIANVSLPSLREAYTASFQQVQWVVLAYLLATTALIVAVGRLGDIVGRRRLMLAGIGLFTAASLACSLAPTLQLLIIARGAQGLGAAVMLALTMAFVGETVPKARTGSAMGLLGTMSAVGTTLGPALGGILIAGFGWRSIFLINLPLGLLTLLLAVRTLPADRRTQASRPPFDVAGTVILALSLTAYALGMTLGRGSFGALNLALLCAAAAGAILFVRVQSKSASPLVRLAMFRDQKLSAGLATTAVVSTVMMSTLVVGPFYLSGALGLDAAAVGLVMATGPVVAALVGMPAGRMVDRFGAARMVSVGLAGMAVGLLALSLAAGAFGAVGYIAAIVVVTAHYALFQAANNTAVMADVGGDQRGAVAGVLSLSRNLGLITGASAMGAVFAFASAKAGFAPTHPEAVAAGMRVCFLLAAGLLVLGLAVAVASRRASEPEGGLVSDAAD